MRVLKLVKSLFGVVDHLTNIADGQSGKRLAYSLIHLLIVVLGFVGFYYVNKLFNSQHNIYIIIALVILVPFTFGLLLETPLMAFYQLIVMIVNSRRFRYERGLAITNLIISLILFGFLVYEVIYIVGTVKLYV